MSSSTEHNSSGNVQSVERAIAVMEYLARHDSAGATQVGEALGIHKSTAFRILNTLVDRALVEQNQYSGKYELGLGLVHLASSVRVGPDITRQAQAGCEWLAQNHEDTVTLSVLESYESVTIDQILSSTTVSSRSWLGRRTPLHCSSPGKVFLAFLDEPERSELLAGPHKRYTENTIVDPDELTTDINAVREFGYATTSAEFEEDLSAAAAPVLGADGNVVAAIGLSAPYYRLDREGLRAAKPLVQKAAEIASANFRPASFNED